MKSHIPLRKYNFSTLQMHISFGKFYVYMQKSHISFGKFYIYTLKGDISLRNYAFSRGERYISPRKSQIFTFQFPCYFWLDPKVTKKSRLNRAGYSVPSVRCRV